MDKRMCPCGCGDTWDSAVREMMRDGLLNKEQANERLESVQRQKEIRMTRDSG